MNTDTRRTYNTLLRQAQKGLGVRRVNVTLSAAEYEQIAASAAGFDERVTTHLKRCALAHIETRYLVPPEIEKRLDAFVAVMRGIGNNLNQLARHSNTTHIFVETEEVRDCIRRLESEVQRFLTTPPRADSTAAPP